ncbi:MAG TPA: sulfur transferase domain-containing protein [Dokdonella sp.]
MPSIKGTFGISLLVGALAVIGWAAAVGTRAGSRTVAARALAGDVWVAEQLETDQLAALKVQGFRTIVDLRPDGEAPDQPPAREMSSAAEKNGLHFTYLPVPHGDIPLPAVDTLERTLATSERPVLLYCRSGRRAARTWALAEASRKDGLGAAAIEAAVASAGQSADDLAAQIAARVAARAATP